LNEDEIIGPDNRKGVESTWLRTCCQYQVLVDRMD